MNKKPFVTGSAAYGKFNTYNSGIDIVMMEYHADMFKALLLDRGVKVTDNDPDYDTPGYYFSFFGRLVNIIRVADELEYDSLRAATDTLQDISPIVSRSTRVEKFKTLMQISINENKPKKKHWLKRMIGSIAEPRRKNIPCQK